MFAMACLEALGDMAGESRLIVYSVDSSNDREQATRQLAKGLHDWKSVDYFKIDSDLSQPFRLPAGHEVDGDELWMCMPSNPVEKCLQQKLPNAELVFYEDGLHAYNDPFGWNQLLRNPRRLAKWMLLGCRRHLALFRKSSRSTFPNRRIDRAYLLLGDRLKLASQYFPRKEQPVVIPSDCLEKVARRMSDIPGFTPPVLEDPPRTVVFLGCIFAQCGMARWEDEFNVYRRVIEDVLNRGFDVLWKEHPRADQPFGDRLKDEFPGRVITQSMNKLIPAEVFFAVNRVAACISPHSTSLLTLQSFGVPVFHLVDHCEPFYNEAYRPAVELVEEHVPPLQKLESVELEKERC